MNKTVNYIGRDVVYGIGRRLSLALFPPRCLLCGEPGGGGLDLCQPCNRNLPWLGVACRRCALPLPASETAGICGACQRGRSPLQQVRAAFLYQAPLNALVLRFKFHRDLSAGRLLAMLMAQALAGAERPQALVPVSLHLGRLRQRGYDQSLELAKPLGRALQLPVCTLLQRRHATAPQSELDQAARRRNLRSAFTVAGSVPAHVALVDDVMTTGATAQAAARALHRAGATRVDAWVVARVP